MTVTAINVPTVTLMNAAQPNVEMPVIGLGVGAYGTVNGSDGEWWDDATCSISVQQWLALGGRRLDTSLKVCCGLGLLHVGRVRDTFTYLSPLPRGSDCPPPFPWRVC
jgi:hypothetical protein